MQNLFIPTQAIQWQQPSAPGKPGAAYATLPSSRAGKKSSSNAAPHLPNRLQLTADGDELTLSFQSAHGNEPASRTLTTVQLDRTLAKTLRDELDFRLASEHSDGLMQRISNRIRTFWREAGEPKVEPALDGDPLSIIFPDTLSTSQRARAKARPNRPVPKSHGAYYSRGVLLESRGDSLKLRLTPDLALERPAPDRQAEAPANPVTIQSVSQHEFIRLAVQDQRMSLKRASQSTKNLLNHLVSQYFEGQTEDLPAI